MPITFFRLNKSNILNKLNLIFLNGDKQAVQQFISAPPDGRGLRGGLLVELGRYWTDCKTRLYNRSREKKRNEGVGFITMRLPEDFLV
jgi:hypothetical protein